MNDEGESVSTGINGGNLRHRPQSAAGNGGNRGGGVGSMSYRNLLNQPSQVDHHPRPHVAIGSATESVKSEPNDAAADIVEIPPQEMETRNQSPTEEHSVPLQTANRSQTLLTNEECENPAGDEGGKNGAKENERNDSPMRQAAAKIEKCVKCDLELKGVLNPNEPKAHQAVASHSEVHLEWPHIGPSGGAIRSHHQRQHGAERIQICISNEDAMQALEAVVSECFPLVNMKSYYRKNYSVRKSTAASSSTASTEKKDQVDEISTSQAAANKLIKPSCSVREDGGKPTVSKRLSSISNIAGGDGSDQQRSDAKRRKFDNPRIRHSKTLSVPHGAPPIENEEEAKIRFQIELEFVQCLANPNYLNYLAQRDYFKSEAFVNYLKYLLYWKRQEYAVYLIYPQCLYFLEVLQDEKFRDAQANLQNCKFVEDQQILQWQYYVRKRMRLMNLPPLSATAAGNTNINTSKDQQQSSSSGLGGP